MSETIVAPATSGSPSTTTPAAPSTPEVKQSSPSAPVAKGGEPVPTAGVSKPVEPQKSKLGIGSTVKTDNHTFEIKVNGEQIYLTTDEARQYVQLGVGSRQKFTEAQKMRQQAESLIRLLKEDPIKVLQHPSIGHDFKKLAEKELMRHIEMEKMTPEQRELAEAREKLKSIESEKRTLEERQHAERVEGLAKQYKTELSKDIIATLEKADVPKTPSTVRRMAYYMNEGLKRGIALSASDVVDLVKADHIRDVQSILGSTEGDKLLSILGDDIARKVREADLARMQGKPPNTPKPEELPPVVPKEAPKAKTLEEWRAEMDKKFGALRAV